MKNGKLITFLKNKFFKNELNELEKLKKENIINSYTIALNYEKLNLQHFQLNFKLKNYQSTQKIINFFKNHKNATFATISIGKYDLSIELIVKTNAELKTIIKEQTDSQLVII